MQELLNHIKAANAKTRAWVAAGPNRGAGLYPEDEAYWVERGISTVAELERENLITFIHDGHKDAYGFRNRGYDFDSMSMAELEAEADRISDAIEAENKRMEEMYAYNTAKFEKLVAKYEAMAGSRKSAIRWILQAEGLENEWDTGYICYSLGLPYSMQDEFKGFCKLAS
tara:strand:- start:3131 stop:3640 length:510 start_codon:yes stop_codon:yes gene_type:complete